MVESGSPTQPVSKYLSIQEIGSSLLALSVAPTGPDGLPEVNPSPSGRTVSCGGVINRLWEARNNLLDYLMSLGTDEREKQLVETLLKIRESCRHQIANVTAAWEKYTAFLRQTDSDKDKGLDSKQVHSAKLIISEWNSVMCPPKNWTQKRMIDKANAAYLLIIQNARKKGRKIPEHRNTMLVYQNDFERIARCQRIIDLEETTGIAIPFPLLRKLSVPGVRLDIVEADTVKQWVAKVNSCSTLDVKTLHVGLRTIVSHLGLPSGSEEGRPSSLAFLEHHLLELGMTLLDGADSEHLAWRVTLCEAMRTIICGQKYSLESLLGKVSPFLDTVDRHIVHTIVGNRESVIVVGHNEAALGIEAAAAYENPGVIPVAAVRVLSSSGSLAVVERLAIPLSHYPWRSNSNGIDSDDQNAFSAVAAMLRALMQQEKTPPINVRDLMFTTEGELRLVRRIKEGARYDFDRLVRLAYDASNRNLNVFRLLLTRSGIAEHTATEFYSDIVENALKGDKAQSIEHMAGKKGLSDTYVARAKKLNKDVLDLLERCCSELTLSRYFPANMDSKLVESRVKDIIVACYKDSVGAGILCPQLEDSILEIAVNALGCR